MTGAAVALALLIFLTTGCSGGRAPVDSPVIPPSKLVDFTLLYSENCAGCHGPDGKGGVAMALGDPVYLAIADDAAIRRVVEKGVSGTGMPAFAQTDSITSRGTPPRKTEQAASSFLASSPSRS